MFSGKIIFVLLLVCSWSVWGECDGKELFLGHRIQDITAMELPRDGDVSSLRTNI